MCDSDREKAQTRFGNSIANEELIFTETPMRSGFPIFIGFSQDLATPKYAYKACLDEVGTADILEVENATLRGSDRELLLRALSSRVNNDQLRIADKYSDIYVPNPKDSGTFTVQKY